MLNHSDKDFRFRYVQFDQLQWSENTYLSELTSVLAFYAYMVIGLDYDSFSPNGGSASFQKAMSIVNAAQSSGGRGWKAFEDKKNRYWMVNNHMDQFFKPMRQLFYGYHRLGFDQMTSNLDAGRAAVTEAITGLERVHSTKPNSFNVQLFFNAKSDELVKLYQTAPPQEKVKMATLLKKLNPGNTAKYQKLLTSK